MFQQIKEDEKSDAWTPVATIHPVASTAAITTTSATTIESQNFSLILGNISSTNFCNITPTNFDKLTTFYRQYCVKEDAQAELPEEKDGEG